MAQKIPSWTYKKQKKKKENFLVTFPLFLTVAKIRNGREMQNEKLLKWIKVFFANFNIIMLDMK